MFFWSGKMSVRQKKLPRLVRRLCCKVCDVFNKIDEKVNDSNYLALSCLSSFLRFWKSKWLIVSGWGFSWKWISSNSDKTYAAYGRHVSFPNCNNLSTKIWQVAKASSSRKARSKAIRLPARTDCKQSYQRVDFCEKKWKIWHFCIQIGDKLISFHLSAF